MAQKQKTHSPRLWLWALVAVSGFMAGANLVARMNGDNTKAGFITGLFSGTVLVGAISGLHGLQATKSHRAEVQALLQRWRRAQSELAPLNQLAAQQQERQLLLQQQLSQAQQQAEAITGILQQAQRRLMISEAAVIASKASITGLEKQLKAAQLTLKTAQAEASRSADAAWKRGQAMERQKAQGQIASLQHEQAQAVTALELQITNLQDQLEKAQAEIEAWETDFDEQLQQLGEAQAQDIRQQVTLQVKSDYQARLDKVANKIPLAVEKRCNKLREKWLRELQTQLEVITAQRNQALQQVQHYKEEFVGITADLESNLGDSELHQTLQAQIQSLQGAVEQRNKAISNYQERISTLEAPRLFPGGYDNHRGNILIRHAQAQGIVLDALHRSRNTEGGQETYYFSARHPEPPRDVIARLNSNSLRLQHELDSKKLVQFEYDSDSLTYYCKIQIFEKRLSRDDIDRKWLKASKFKALVKDVCAFRVSANKGGSKSPTVRNILGAKLLEGEKFKIRRYDPSAGSRKDYWRVAPTWRSYHEALKMAAEIEALILRRQREKSARNGAEFDWVYFVIDELDNTISTLAGEKVISAIDDEEISAAKVVMDAIAKAIKEGEHLQIGILLCTQTPNVRQLMKTETIDKAFFNNLAQIVVEANVFDYLSSSTDQTKKPQLASDYRTVYDWCDQQNSSIEDQARKYRPALYVNKAKRDIIELPMLGEFGFDKLDPAQPYDFDEFNAYEYNGARSLDQALLMASKEQVARTSGIGQPAPNSPPAAPQSAPNLSVGSSQAQPQASSGNVAVIADPRVLSKTDSPPKCPICGDELKSNGKGKGKYKGMKQLACRSQHHTAQMGSKTYDLG